MASKPKRKRNYDKEYLIRKARGLASWQEPSRKRVDTPERLTSPPRASRNPSSDRARSKTP